MGFISALSRVVLSIIQGDWPQQISEQYALFFHTMLFLLTKKV